MNILNNENPIIRAVRLAVMGAAVIVVEAVIAALPNVSLPSQYAPLIMLVAVPLLAAADKWLRTRVPAQPAPPTAP